MNYNFTVRTAGQKADQLFSNKSTVDNENKDGGLSFLKKGQLITGKVVSVDDQITLDFDGQKITASKNVLSNVNIGDTKTFEVLKASDTEIELRAFEDNLSTGQKTFTAAMVKDSDWESILERKKQKEKKTERDSEYKETKKNLEEVSARLTGQDISNLEAEGFPAESYTVSGLNQALDRVKSNTGQSTSDITSSSGDISLKKRLEQENLPATAENLAKLSKAMELGGAVAVMGDKAMQYLISTGADPSAENIYKANYSGYSNGQGNSVNLSDQAWSQLESQVKEVITSSGYEVNEENLADAKWLIENQLPLTQETFAYKKDLEDIKASADPQVILDKMLTGMKNGTNPKDVSLLTADSSDYEKTIADIDSIGDTAIAEAVREGGDLSIKRLATIQESLANGENVKETQGAVSDAIEEQAATETAKDLQTSETVEKDYAYEELKAKRQLEEIRYKMTLEAANQLKKQGIDIDTQELGKVVENLKELEDNYYKNMLKEADAEASALSVQTLKETTEGIDKLKLIPISVLGSTLSVRSSETINGLLSEGSILQANYEKAGQAYETLATVPNSEYGDSIKKAFANADSLLSEMDLDSTEQNQRAVRILGYNQMAITEESITQVKAYDTQVTNMMQNLHPAVAVRMIKEGINPLNMPISELNSTIDRIKEEQGITSEEKYSTYLQNLEKNDGISEEDRKAYIGIYRLLYNVEKSDGAALGSVIKADREVTLGNLLTAVATNKKGSIDAVIDDEFGTLQSISKDKETIAEQLSTFTGSDTQQGQSDNETAAQEKTEYLNRILKQMKDELTPEKLMETGDSITQASDAANQTLTAEQLLSSDKKIWDKVKDVPVEKLLEQMRNTDTTAEADDAVYAAKAQEIRELCKTSEQSIRFLNDYRMPSTPMNIMMANYMLSNGESAIKKQIKLNSENKVENSENTLMETNDLSDKLIDKSSMQEAYEELEADGQATIENACSAEKIDSFRLAELKSMGQQLTFMRKMAEKEFYQIPIETDKGITNMNLTILRGTETSGKVAVNVWSEQLGNIRAEFTLKDQSLKGYFSSDSKDGLEQLQKCTGEIENAALESNVTIKQMDFGVVHKESDTYSYQNSNTDGSSDSTSNDTERILYRIAKAVVQTVRMAENSGSDLDKAVS